MFVACMIATLILAVMTALPLSRAEAWWVRALDFPRLQLAILAFALLLIEMVVLDSSDPRSWSLYVITAVCLAWQAWWIAPFTPWASVEAHAAPTDGDSRNAIRILTANVLGPNRCSEKLLDLVRVHAPDILVTLESNAWWQEQLDALESDYPHTVKCAQENLYGMHVYSRLPLSESRVNYLVEKGIPSIHTCVTLRSGHRVTAHFLHPEPPNPKFNDESSERDAELVIVARSVAESDGPMIVSGDLNDVAWSSTTRLFRKLSGLLDPRVGRGMFNTYNANWWFMRWPLDHLFHSSHFTLLELRRLPAIGSDHFPLLTTLLLESEAAPAQQGLDADSTDAARADAKAAGEGVRSDDVPQPGQGGQDAKP